MGVCTVLTYGVEHPRRTELAQVSFSRHTPRSTRLERATTIFAKSAYVRQTSGPWSYDETPPTSNERLTITRLEWCLDTLRKAGVEIQQSSRLPASLALLRRVSADPSLLDRDDVRAKLAEVQKMAWEFMLVLLAAVQADRATSPFTYDKVREMLRGNSHARNTQFELYVLALFAHAGFSVSAGAPDARLDFFGEDVAIEAKRVHSLNTDTLRSTFSKAARQVTGKPTAGTIQVVRSRGLRSGPGFLNG
jgi:hypothetical protein